MSQPDDDTQFQQSNLESPAYRQRLMRKINCLIAVLEVACAKVRRSMDGPNPDLVRLQRIQRNLTETLDVCKRAKSALERREKLPADLPSQLAEISSLDSLGEAAAEGSARAAEKVRRGAQVEFGSSDEQQRFRSLGPIRRRELAGLDLDELSRRLQEG
jgi:hypothetical protein